MCLCAELRNLSWGRPLVSIARAVTVFQHLHKSFTGPASACNKDSDHAPHLRGSRAAVEEDVPRSMQWGK